MKIALNAFHGVRSDVNDWKSITDFALAVEDLGVDSIWSSEAWGFDALTPLGFISARTKSIKLGTSIVQIGSRTPANLIMTSLTLQSMSSNRFILGIGTSGPQVMEGWHGVKFDSPVTRTREIIEIFKVGTSGDKINYDGVHYSLPLSGGEGISMRTSAPVVEVPLYVASLGPSNLRMTGELADGWIGGCYMPETGHVFLNNIAEGAKSSGRTLKDLELIIPLSLEFTENVDEVGKSHARGYGFTFGAMGSVKNNFYKNAYARQGYGEAVDYVQRLWKEGRREEARDLVPVDIALKSNLIGTPEMIKERLKLYKDAGITTLKVSLPGDSIDEKISALGKLMDLMKEV